MRNIFLLGFFVFVLIGAVPDVADAARSSYGSSYRSKINKLDDDAVTKLPIPILFGLTLKSITPNFGDPRDGGSRKHEGLDIMAPKGAFIVSPTEAVVVRMGNGLGSGKYVTTANPGGETFIYMHLSEILVKNGQELKAGALIGFVGNTGNASEGAPHLHFEIRDGRKPTDPYLRIREEFTLKEKIGFLNDILADIDEDDSDELVAILVNEYSDVHAQSRAQNITLPDIIAKAFASNGGVPTRTLKIGSTGKDVEVLQGVLIAEKFLKIYAPTGYFGAQTEAALRAYQKAHKISPANGHYGVSTQKYIKKHGAFGVATQKQMTAKEMTAKIVELAAP